MGLELEEIAVGDRVELAGLVELAEGRGRPASHYLAAIPLATELTLAGGEAALTVRVRAGTCQRWGALNVLDALVDRAGRSGGLSIVPVECLDRCDHAAACEIHGAHGTLVVAPATPANVGEALDALA